MTSSFSGRKHPLLRMLGMVSALGNCIFVFNRIYREYALSWYALIQTFILHFYFGKCKKKCSSSGELDLSGISFAASPGYIGCSSKQVIRSALFKSHLLLCRYTAHRSTTPHRPTIIQRLIGTSTISLLYFVIILQFCTEQGLDALTDFILTVFLQII